MLPVVSMLVKVPSSAVGAVQLVFPTMPTLGVDVGVSVCIGDGDGDGLAIGDALAAADGLAVGEWLGADEGAAVAAGVVAAAVAFGLLVGGTIREEVAVPPHPAATATTASAATKDPAARTFIISSLHKQHRVPDTTGHQLRMTRVPC
jgi:hypothetical protein